MQYRMLSHGWRIRWSMRQQWKVKLSLNLRKHIRYGFQSGCFCLRWRLLTKIFGYSQTLLPSIDLAYATWHGATCLSTVGMGSWWPSEDANKQTCMYGASGNSKRICCFDMCGVCCLCAENCSCMLPGLTDCLIMFMNESRSIAMSIHRTPQRVKQTTQQKHTKSAYQLFATHLSFCLFLLPTSTTNTNSI